MWRWLPIYICVPSCQTLITLRSGGLNRTAVICNYILFELKMSKKIIHLGLYNLAIACYSKQMFKLIRNISYFFMKFIQNWETTLIVIINKVLPATKVECNETCKIFENVPNLSSAAIKPRVTTASVILSATVVYHVLSWEL